MRRWLSYVLASALMVMGVTGALWAFLEPRDQRGLAVAGVVAVVVQWAAFGLLLKLRERNNGLLLGMAAGTAARLGALGAAGLAVSFGELDLGPSALVLGLAGFLFALALLEAGFLRGMNGSGQAE